MAIIQFGPWIPDQPRLGSTCITAQNVFPTSNGYKPFAGPVVITSALTTGNKGAITFRRVDGVIETFAGSRNTLWRLSGTTFVDVSKAGSPAYNSVNDESVRWRFALFGSRLIATNGVDAVQAFDLGTDTIFADIAAAPTHRFSIVIRDVLVAIDTTDGSGLEVKFSAVNDSDKWTADCGGGGQDFPDGGPLVGGTGGEFGVILQENAITRMNFVGGDLRFTFDKIEGATGCLSAGSIVQHKGFTFYLSESGFQVFNGAESKNISEGMVTDTFFASLDRSKISTLQGALDLRNKSIVWAYPTSAASAGENDRQIIFFMPTAVWSESIVTTQTVLEDEISPNLLGVDADDTQTGAFLYYDKKPIADLNLSIGDIVSARLEINDSDVVNGRVEVEFFTSGDASLGTNIGNVLQSTTGFEESKVENITIPATAAKVTVSTEWSSAGQDQLTRRAIFNVGATARDYASTDGKILASFDTDNKLARFNGSDLTAILSTGDIQLAKDRRAFVKSVRGLVDAAHDITVGKKTALSDTETTVTGSSNAQGNVSLRANDRYHRFQLDPTATWTEAIGVDVEAQGAGKR